MTLNTRLNIANFHFNYKMILLTIDKIKQHNEH